jgi:hypothetical protein
MRSIQHLAEHSRVWVYQANRFLSEQEIVAISNALSQFIESWNAKMKSQNIIDNSVSKKEVNILL